MKRAQSSVDLLLILVSSPRPEKAFQAVTLAPGNDVHVEMGHALAHAIVDGHKGALRLHPLHNGLREKPDIGKQRADKGVRQIEERLEVALCDKERVAGKQRTMIQKGQRSLVLEDFEARHDAADDVAEKSAFLEHEVIFHLIFYLGSSLA